MHLKSVRLFCLQLVVLPGCIGECMLSCQAKFLSCQTIGFKVYQSLQSERGGIHCHHSPWSHKYVEKPYAQKELRRGEKGTARCLSLFERNSPKVVFVRSPRSLWHLSYNQTKIKFVSKDYSKKVAKTLFECIMCDKKRLIFSIRP